jgi:predicted DNA-binding WGR domain protein
MSAVTLHRIDAVRRMSRFYRLDVQPDLFGREWGRIGRGGQMRETPYPTPADADPPRVAYRRGDAGSSPAVVPVARRCNA